MPVWLEEEEDDRRWVQKEGQSHSNMDGPRDYHTKWNQTEEDKYRVTPHVEHLKYDTKELICKTETDSDIQTCRCQRGGDTGDLHWQFRISRCELSHKEWINNEVLRDSIGNYIQYSVINQNGKEYEKEYIIYAAAAAKALQSCPTLCDPIDGSPPGFAIPGILQARTLEWVAISFSNAWKWKVKVKSLIYI